MIGGGGGEGEALFSMLVLGGRQSWGFMRNAGMWLKWHQNPTVSDEGFRVQDGR